MIENTRVSEIQDQILILKLQIKKIQSNCEHNEFKELNDYSTIHKPVFVEHVYDSNSGNYDPSSDSYWVTYTCKICEQTWTVYSE